MMTKEERVVAIKALKDRTEKYSLYLSQAIGGYRGLCEAMSSQLDRTDAVNAELKTALSIIAGRGCENYTSPTWGACITNRPSGRDGEYEAESWCHSCIAYDVLKRGGGKS